MAPETLTKEALFSYLIDDIQVREDVLSKAKNDCGESLSIIATIYYDKKKYKRAMHWYLLAAHQDHTYSQYKIGFMYQCSLGVNVDYNAARKWFLKAADNGDSSAMYLIGNHYEHGLGVPKCQKTALEWFLKAARQGDKVAQENVGRYFENGYGTQVDKKMALEWYGKSAIQGNQTAKRCIDRLNDQGHFLNAEQKDKFHMKLIASLHKQNKSLEKMWLKVICERHDQFRLIEEVQNDLSELKEELLNHMEQLEGS